MSYIRVVLLQKEVEASPIWNRLPMEYDAQTYQLVTVSLDAKGHDDATDYVLAILDEIGWADAVLIAHAADIHMAQEVAAHIPERISGLFLINPSSAPSDFPHSSNIPTLVVASEITNTLFPGSELLKCAPPATTTQQLVEIFHAFCSLRVTYVNKNISCPT